MFLFLSDIKWRVVLITRRSFFVLIAPQVGGKSIVSNVLTTFNAHRDSNLRINGTLLPIKWWRVLDDIGMQNAQSHIFCQHKIFTCYVLFVYFYLSKQLIHSIVFWSNSLSSQVIHWLIKQVDIKNSDIMSNDEMLWC